jgi:hypothetical protein
MPSIYTTSDFLRAFSNVHETFDIRVAAIRDNEQWLLVALSAHLRIVSSETAKQDFQDTIKRFGKVDSSAFRIVQQCLPVAEAKQFFDKISNGELVLEGLRFRLSEPHDVLSFAGNVHVDYQNVERWPRIELQRQITKDPNARQLLHNNAEILRDTELAGYEFPHIAVKTLLDIDFSTSNEPGMIWIACDIPVRLLPPKVAQAGDEFELKLRAESHSAIDNVSCTIRRTGGIGSSILQQSVVVLTRSNEKKNSASWSGDIQLPIERDDQITLEALSRDVGRLYSTRIWPFALLPPEQANPLLAALELFCPLDQIRLLLEQPQNAKTELKNISNAARLFEVSVQWLLSTLNYRAVWLHGYERIKDANVELGTIDCLAYSEEENILLLVNCSLAAPDPSELHRHENLATRISKQLFPDSRVKVCSALFTTSHRPETEQKKAYGSAVRVFFKEDIDQLLQAARAGHRFEYLRFLNPFTS